MPPRTFHFSQPQIDELNGAAIIYQKDATNKHEFLNQFLNLHFPNYSKNLRKHVWNYLKRACTIQLRDCDKNVYTQYYISPPYKFHKIDSSGTEHSYSIVYKCEGSCNYKIKVTLYPNQIPKIEPLSGEHSCTPKGTVFRDIEEETKIRDLMQITREHHSIQPLTSEAQILSYLLSEATKLERPPKIPENLPRTLYKEFYPHNLVIPDFVEQILSITKQNSENFLKYIAFYPEPIIIFGYDRSVSICHSATKLFLDGTFKIVPRQFDDKGQLLTLMVLDQTTNEYIPVVHILMKSRTAEAYTTAFSALISIIGFNNFKTVYVDFEIALYKSIKLFCPNAKVTGCLFHYRQALIRKIKELYPKQEIPKEIFTLYQIYSSLPFVEKDSFYQILKLIDESSSEIAKPFVNYYKKVWKKDYEFINQLDSEDDIYTNNALESFHSLLSKELENAHPSLEIMIAILMKVDKHLLDKQLLSTKPAKHPVNYTKSTANIKKAITNYLSETNRNSKKNQIKLKEFQQSNQVNENSIDFTPETGEFSQNDEKILNEIPNDQNKVVNQVIKSMANPSNYKFDKTLLTENLFSIEQKGITKINRTKFPKQRSNRCLTRKKNIQKPNGDLGEKFSKITRKTSKIEKAHSNSDHSSSNSEVTDEPLSDDSDDDFEVKAKGKKSPYPIPELSDGSFETPISSESETFENKKISNAPNEKSTTDKSESDNDEEPISSESDVYKEVEEVQNFKEISNPAMPKKNNVDSDDDDSWIIRPKKEIQKNKLEIIAEKCEKRLNRVRNLSQALPKFDEDDLER